jgi:hypothetical protein
MVWACPERRGALGGADYVGEQDGREHAVRLAIAALAGAERLDLVEALVGV